MHYRMLSRSISFLGENVLNSWTERSYVSMSLFSFRMSPLSAVLAKDHLSSSMFVGYNRCHYKEDYSSWGFMQRQLDTATSGMPGRSACCERSCSTKIGKGVPAWATGPLGHSIQLYGLVISVEFVWKLDTPRSDASFRCSLRAMTILNPCSGPLLPQHMVVSEIRCTQKYQMQWGTLFTVSIFKFIRELQ